LDPELKLPTKAVLMERLVAATTEDEIEDVLWQLGARRRGGGEELRFLMGSPSPRVRAALALTLGAYRGSAARKLLSQLADDPDDAVRADARESLTKRPRE
jgi:hypothetical protein